MRLRSTIPIAVLAAVSITGGTVLITTVLSNPTATDAAQAVAGSGPPVAIAQPNGTIGTRPRSYASGAHLVAYNRAAGTAMLAAAHGTASTLKPGDVVASAPTPAAPDGALFTVGSVRPTQRGVEVRTRPATLRDALGATQVTRTARARDLNVTIKRLAPGVQPAPGATPSGADPSRSSPSTSPPSAPAAAPPSDSGTASASTTPSSDPAGRIRLAVALPLDGVSGISGTGSGGPTVTGWVSLTPRLVFAFGRKTTAGDPYQAEIGVGGDYGYGWQVHVKLAGTADTGEQALRIPLAEVHLSTTFWVGPIPVVISADLTYFYRLTATGDLSLDTEQSTTGTFAFGVGYQPAGGWGPLNQQNATTITQALPTLAGRGDARATIGADLSVRLYGAVGVTGRLAPYLRATIDATANPLLWALYLGVDLTGTVGVDLNIFGITLVSAKFPLPLVHGEWPVAASTPTPSTPTTPTTTQPQPGPEASTTTTPDSGAATPAG
ncbi:MAG TPA: hypothetical protein VJT31_12890 [Rugosimonospora sp.]|nr:hypothetical protein [Rugosimonospora sp.]